MRVFSRLSAAPFAVVLAGLFAAPSAAEVQVFGSGCPAGNGVVPALRASGLMQPGSGVELTVATGDANAVGVLGAGLSNTSFGTQSLPLGLGSLGLAGCDLWISGEFVFALDIGADGVAPFPVTPLPLGATLFAQAFALADGAIGASAALELRVTIQPDPFVVVMLPDTQHYSDSATNALNFEAQTEWIVANKTAENIRFTTLVGDIVENGAEGPNDNLVEWQRADAALSTLDGDLSAQPDGELPWAAVCGNHDYDVVYQKGAATRYREFFGPDRFAGRSWFVGASSNEVNMAQLFEVDGWTYLSLGLEWHPSDTAIEWAQGVLRDHPDVPAIVSTHEHIRAGVQSNYSDAGQTLNGAGNNAAESVYRKLIEPFPQIFLVLSGHVIGDGRRVSTTALGQKVHEVLADYQADPGGGNGWMQLLRFDPAAGTIAFDTFSPTYVPGVTPGPNRFDAPQSNFTLAFDLAGHRAELQQTTERRFRTGQAFGAGAYTGMRSTYIGSGANQMTLPDVPYASQATLRVDADQDQEQTLLAFDDIVGTGPGQVPAGTQVRRAVLTLTTEGSNAASVNGAGLHRMTVPWGLDATWELLGDGVQLGSEALVAADVETGAAIAQNGTHSFDVTSSVQAWVNGETNHGWVLVANGSDRWELRSGSWSAVAERPLLTIVY